MTTGTQQSKVPKLAIVLFIIVLIAVFLQIPYYIKLTTGESIDLSSLPSLPSELGSGSGSDARVGANAEPVNRNDSAGYVAKSLDLPYIENTTHVIHNNGDRGIISNSNDTLLATNLIQRSHSNQDRQRLQANTLSQSNHLIGILPICYNNSNRSYCCAESWEHDIDEWWQHHPDWDVSLETNETYCFSPIEDPERASFLRNRVYPLQWQTSCENTTAFRVINSGYSANLGLLGRAFVTALNRSKTFLESKRKEDFIWRYSNTPDGKGTCPTRDMECYFLPISNCKSELNQHEGFDLEIVNDLGGPYTKEITWLQNYLVRPNLWMRRRVYDVLSVVPVPSQPCAVIHVRRTDVVLEGNWKKRRHYFTIADYLHKIKDVPSVVLLTDDQTAIDEMHEFHANEKNWTYIHRKRWRGTEGGMNGHIPSGDAVQEVAYILAEQKLASYCDQLVFTRSGFADMLLIAMQIRKWGVKKTRIDFRKQPTQTYFEDADQFFAKLDAKRNATLVGTQARNTSMAVNSSLLR